MLLPGFVTQIPAIAYTSGCAHRAELAGGFAGEIEFTLGWPPVKPHTGREITPVGGLIAWPVAFVEVVQVQFGVDFPGYVVDFQKTAGKPGAVFRFVEAVKMIQ